MNCPFTCQYEASCLKHTCPQDKALTAKFYIDLGKCEDRNIYFINARNGLVGVFRKETKGFILSRHKFDSNFLFEEYHYDTGEPYGTVKPIEKLMVCDVLVNDKPDNKELLNLLNRITLDIVRKKSDRPDCFMIESDCDDCRDGKCFAEKCAYKNKAIDKPKANILY
jgi:hypothetical protein